MVKLFNQRISTFYDGEGENKKAEEPRTYTQEELEKAIEAERTRLNETSRKAINELETLKKNKSLSDSEKSELQKKIDELNSQYMTKEELFNKEKNKLVESYEDNLKNLSQDRDSWKHRYVDSTIARELTDAANRADAHDSSVFLALLRPNTELVDVTDDDGKVTGFKVKVKLADTDKDGKPIVLDLTPEQSIKMMKDKPERYGYLFKPTTNSGVGGSGSKSQLTKTDLKGLSPEQYRKERERLLK